KNRCICFGLNHLSPAGPAVCGNRRHGSGRTRMRSCAHVAVSDRLPVQIARPDPTTPRTEPRRFVKKKPTGKPAALNAFTLKFVPGCETTHADTEFGNIKPYDRLAGRVRPSYRTNHFAVIDINPLAVK